MGERLLGIYTDFKQWFARHPSLVVPAILLFGLALCPLHPRYGCSIAVASLVLMVTRWLSNEQRVALVVTSFVYVYYVFITKIPERNIDSLRHLEYIHFICREGAIPPGSFCLICHHPPLYHLLGALAQIVSDLFEIPDPRHFIQALSVPIMLAFAMAAAAMFSRIIKRPWLGALGTLLCSLWPYSIIMSGRIHNDVLANALMAWTIYAAYRLYETPERKWLLWSLGLACASVFTKMSGLLVLGVVIVAIAGAMTFAPVDTPALWGCSAQRRKRWQLVRAPLIGTFALLSLFVVTRDRSMFDANSPELVAQGPAEELDSQDAGAAVFGTAWSAAIDQRLESTAFDYLYVDLRDLLKEPYAVARTTSGGNELFWNHYLKSSLFSTSNRFPDSKSSYRFNHNIASVLMAILLWIIGASLVFVGTREIDFWKRHWVLTTSTVLLIGGATFFRMLEATSHHSDFRHAFAVLLPALALFMLAVQDCASRRSPLATVHIGLSCMFCVLASIYYVPKYIWLLSFEEQGPVTFKYSRMQCGKSELKLQGLSYRAQLEWNQWLVVTFREVKHEDLFYVYTDGSDSYEVEFRGSSGEYQATLPTRKTDNAGRVRHEFGIPAEIGDLQSIIMRPQFGDKNFGIGCMQWSSELEPEPTK